MNCRNRYDGTTGLAEGGAAPSGGVQRASRRDNESLTAGNATLQRAVCQRRRRRRPSAVLAAAAVVDADGSGVKDAPLLRNDRPDSERAPAQ